MSSNSALRKHMRRHDQGLKIRTKQERDQIREKSEKKRTRVQNGKFLWRKLKYRTFHYNCIFFELQKLTFLNLKINSISEKKRRESRQDESSDEDSEPFSGSENEVADELDEQ